MKKDLGKGKRVFLDLFNVNNTLLKVKFNTRSDENPLEVQIRNELGGMPNVNELSELSKLCNDEKLRDFVGFYSKYDGFKLATLTSLSDILENSLFRQVPISELREFTKQYLPNGEFAWVIDLNKSKAIYRGEDEWLVFAKINSGPMCLTIFLSGENTGKVYLLNPQPHFNILKPIANSYTELLNRIAKDPAIFLKLIKAYVTLIGKDQQCYGYVPVEYIDNKQSI